MRRASGISVVTFPDTDAQFQGVDSRILLRAVVSKLVEKGWRVGNVDITVVAQAPRLSDFIGSMEEHIATDLGVEVECRQCEGDDHRAPWF